MAGRGPSRREILVGTGLAATGLLSRSAKADPARTRAVMDALIGGRTPTKDRVDLQIPEVADDGAVVPVTVEVESPMTEEDHVTAVHLFNERNPDPEVASFHFTPRSGRATVSTRIRLAESQRVHAVAEMSDGSVHVAARDVTVVAGGCFS